MAYRAQRFNTSVGVTRLLVFDRGQFAQVIEGAHESVDKVVARIRDDALHRGIQIFIDEPIESLLFPNGSMLNSIGRSIGSLKIFLQFALDKGAADMAPGQIEATRHILDRLT